MPFDSVTVGQTIGAIGALGTAAFGLVDGFKSLPNGGISNAGFNCIVSALAPFTGLRERTIGKKVALPPKGDAARMLDTLHGNWVNGMVASDQKAIAKALVKLQLNGSTATRFADATGVAADLLGNVGQKMSTGASLTADEVNVLGRFDVALSAILDDGYQHGDQRYRNLTKLVAMLVAVLLAVAGGVAISTQPPFSAEWFADMCKSVLAGLIATPLAPMSKDVASALTAGVKVAQSVGA